MLSESANQFAVELFHCYLSRHGDRYRNLLLCPYLIYHSLAMMLVGAKGDTQAQLMKLLRINKSSAASHNCSSSSSSSSSSGHSQSKPATKHDSSERLASPRQRAAVKSTLSGVQLISRSSSKLQSGAQRKSSSQRKCCTSQTQKGAKETLDAHKSSSLINKSLRSNGGVQDEARHRQFLMLTEQLIHGNHEFVHLASFIYLDKSTKRTESYKNILRDFYETKPKKVDFNNADLMVKTINEDVARTTENIYSDILSRQEAQKLEKSYMLLVNAVFFRGFWLSNFTDVKKGAFFKYPNQAAADKTDKRQPMQYSVNMMSKLDYLPVVADQQLDARIVKMPFEASDLQMLLILPNDVQSDSTYLCDKISAQKIQQIADEFAKSKCKTVRISMPIFCVDSGKISIQSTLVTMGAGDLFDETKANLSGVCENRQIWLNKILHRCFIVCDNRGSITSSSFEKAKRRQARLESGISTGRSGVDDFLADHPFMYIIMDSLTKTILLIGLYTDPSETLEVIHESQLSPEEAHQIYTEGVYKT